jgi:hypothetical protein
MIGSTLLRIRRVFARSFGFLMLMATPATARQGAILGTVRSLDDDSRVARVIVTLNGRVTVLTDTDGIFRFDDVNLADTIRLAFRRIGYREMEHALWFAERDTVPKLAITLEPLPLRLEDIRVEEDAPGPRHLIVQGFFERRKLGFGKFMTREEIEDRNPLLASDLLRMFPSRFRVFCTLYVDGILVDVSRRGGAAGTLNELLPPSNIEAIEVYGGVADAPTRFGGTRDCRNAILVVWTR